MQTGKTRFQESTLLELGNIGTGNAVNALSKLMNTYFELEVGHFFSRDNEAPFPNSVVLSVPIESDTLEGNVLLVISPLLKQRLVEIMVDNIKEPNLTNMADSILCEVGNIMCGAYLSAVSGMLSAHMPGGLVQMHTNWEALLMAEVEVAPVSNVFYLKQKECAGSLIFCPKKSLNELMIDRFSSFC